MLTLCPNLTVAQHVSSLKALDKVLKVHWNIFGQFQQCSEVSEKSSEMFEIDTGMIFGNSCQ